MILYTIATDLDTAKQQAMWGTYGKGGVEHCGGQCPEHRLRWVKLCDCTSDHLLAILRTQPIMDSYQVIIASILYDRGVAL